MLHRHLAGPGRPVQLHERERGALRGHERVDLADTLRPGHLEQHDRSGRLHPGVPGTLRGYERIHVTDALRCGDVQPQLIIQLLHGLPGHPSGELLRARCVLSYSVQSGDLAEPDGTVKLHRGQPWTLCIWIREHERDSMRPRNLDRSVGSELVHAGIPWVLRGHERVDDADSMWFGDIQS